LSKVENKNVVSREVGEAIGQGKQWKVANMRKITETT